VALSWPVALPSHSPARIASVGIPSGSPRRLETLRSHRRCALGSRREPELVFAGLHQLCTPILARRSSCPGGRRPPGHSEGPTSIRPPDVRHRWAVQPLTDGPLAGDNVA
jgi:hypothetical protein